VIVVEDGVDRSELFHCPAQDCTAGMPAVQPVYVS
jgi:hypothetical protein